MSLDATGQNTRSDPRWRRQLRRKLAAWYRGHARDLPWRRTRDPYAVWVSEIMLQQTQVATVAGYFARFLAALPTIASLAAAPQEQVLRLWEGLGYYRRARQLHQAAQVIVREHGGRFPADRSQAMSLPGIGRYTAGAILSIAFDLPEPILEANTFRLLSRLIGYHGNPQSTSGRQMLWGLAEELVPAAMPGDFNQALMELGSLVCTPRAPRCEQCPLAALCRGYQAGMHEQLGRAPAKPASTAVTEAAVVVLRRKRVLLVQRAGEGRWAGLWDFPRFPLAGKKPSALAEEAGQELLQRYGVEAAALEPLVTLKHSVTRFRITLHCYQARHVRGTPAGDDIAATRWVRPGELPDFPLSMTGRKLARLLIDRGAGQMGRMMKSE